MSRLFIYGGSLRNEPPAYFIIPKNHEAAKGKFTCTIFHQYGCVCCDHFEIEGTIEPITDKAFVEKIDRVLECDSGVRDADVASVVLGMEVRRVMGEALLELADGRYIATCNCD